MTICLKNAALCDARLWNVKADILVEDGVLSIQAGTDSTDPGKGIKSDGSIVVTGGSVQVNSLDDAIHANDSVTIRSGDLVLSSSDDGIHADNALVIDGGSIQIEESYEGLEAKEITINDGEMSIRSRDDGINAAGGNDGSNGFGPFGGDPFQSKNGGTLTINGGTLFINAGGDGLDSNGDLTVNGGETYVSGPTNSGNGAIDYNGTGTINGGIVVAAGASGMAENFGSASTQGTILYNFSASQQAGTTVTLTDTDGEDLARYAPEKAFQSVVISAPGVEAGESYTLTAGSEKATIDMTATVYGNGMGMGGFGGPGMGGRGMQGGGMGRPQWEDSQGDGAFAGGGHGGMGQAPWDESESDDSQMSGFVGPGMGGHMGFGARR